MNKDKIIETITAINNTIPIYEITSEGIVYRDAETNIAFIALEWIPIYYLPKWTEDDGCINNDYIIGVKNG